MSRWEKMPPTKQIRLYTPSVNLSLSLDHEVDTPGILFDTGDPERPQISSWWIFHWDSVQFFVTQHIQDSDFQTNLPSGKLT